VNLLLTLCVASDSLRRLAALIESPYVVTDGARVDASVDVFVAAAALEREGTELGPLFESIGDLVLNGARSARDLRVDAEWLELAAALLTSEVATCAALDRILQPNDELPIAA
jgi:hypothetical protein